MIFFKWLLILLALLPWVVIFDVFPWYPNIIAVAVFFGVNLLLFFVFYKKKGGARLLGGVATNLALILAISLFGFLSPDLGKKKLFEDGSIILTSEVHGISSCGASFVVYKKVSLGYFKYEIFSSKECFRKLDRIKRVSDLNYIITVSNQRKELKTVEWDGRGLTK